MPLVEELPSIEADVPIAAIGNRLLRWAGVVVSDHRLGHSPRPPAAG